MRHLIPPTKESVKEYKKLWYIYYWWDEKNMIPLIESIEIRKILNKRNNRFGVLKVLASYIFIAMWIILIWLEIVRIQDIKHPLCQNNCERCTEEWLNDFIYDK